MKEQYFFDQAYRFFPKNISFIDDKGNINNKYLNSLESHRLSECRTAFFEDKKTIEKIKKAVNNLGEFRDISNLEMDDRSLTMQNSDFYFENSLKFYPICVTISSILKNWHIYVLDIDIELNGIGVSGYEWRKNNGLLELSRINGEINHFVNTLVKVLERELGLPKFPDNIIHKIIPDISFGNLRFGQMTFFNAFFLDDFYAIP